VIPGAAVETFQAHLAEPASGWSIGAFGAIAEFMRDEGETAAVVPTETGGRVWTARGAMNVALGPETRVIAYEGLSKYPDRWTHGVAFCLPRNGGSGSRREGLSELGRDNGAVRDEDRDAILFDMGVGAANVDFCVRTADTALIDSLRRAEGTDILSADSLAMAAIKEANPHRICLSALGRIEVYQRIGSHADASPTPEGPHTHLLPGLLTTGRTHSANTPVPAGWHPCLSLYPAHPIIDAMGHARPFDHTKHGAFQELLERFAPAGYMDEKRRITAAVVAGDDPADYRPAGSRVARTAARIALRQLGHTDGDLPALAAWRRAHGGGGEADDDEH
jgi:hypothetical protein